MLPLPRLAAAAVALSAVLALPVALPGSASAADATTITGHVADDRGAAATNLVVGWLDPTTGDWNDVHTDAAGDYALPIPASAGHVILYTNLTRPVGAIGPYQFESSDSPRPFAVDRSYSWGFYGAGGARSTVFQTLPGYTAPPATLDLLAPRPGRVAFRGALPAAAEVSLVAPDGRTLYTDSASLTVTGAGSIDDLVPGTYRARYSFRSGAHLRETLSEPFTVRENATSTLEAPSRVRHLPSITGIVRRTGAPVKNVEVQLTGGGYHYTARTDARGRYTLRNVAISDQSTTGPHLLFVTPSPRVAAAGIRVSITATALSVVRHDLAVKRSGNIRGTARKGLDDEHLVVRDARGRVLDPDAYRLRVKGKTFRVSGLPAGRWQVGVLGEYRHQYAAATVRVRAGHGTNVGPLLPHRTTLTLSGKAPRASVQLHTAVISPIDPTNTSETYTSRYTPDAHIDYAFTGLLPGTYTVTADGRHREPSFTTVKVIHDTHRRVVPGAKLATIEGRAVVATPDGDLPTLSDLTFASPLVAYRGVYYPDETLGPLGAATANYPDGTYSGESQGTDVTLDARFPIGSELFPYQSPAWVTVPASVATSKHQVENGVLDLDVVRYTVHAEGSAF